MLITIENKENNIHKTCCFFTGYLDQGLLVHDAVKLRKNYFTKKRWYFDFLSVLPTDVLYFWWDNASCNVQVPCPIVVRINRIFRLPRLWEWCERTETATGYPNAFRICKVSEDELSQLQPVISILFELNLHQTDWSSNKSSSTFQWLNLCWCWL